MNKMNGVVNYVIFDNPLSKGVIQVFKGTQNGSSCITPIPIPDNKPLWKLALDQGPYTRIAGVMGASAVIIGAYGAHKSYPKDRADELKSIFETGNRFHFIHSLAILSVPLCRHPALSGTLIIFGTTLFSGTCYYHALTGDKRLGRYAPIGGTILIIGWLTMIL